MTIDLIIKGAYQTIAKRMFCVHDWRIYRTIHGDEANYARSEWRCAHCDEHKYSQSLTEMKP